MTDSPQPYACADRPGDAAAYALHALEPAEARAFVAHLETCVVCRDELTEFQVLVGRLAEAPVQYELPHRARRAVLAAVRRDRAQPAATTRDPRRMWSPRLRLAAGAIAAVAVAAFGLEAAHELRAPAIKSRQIAAHVIGGRGSAGLRVGGGQAELVVHGLPQPRQGHIYEVWLRRAGGAPQPTSALFGVTSGGSGEVVVPGDLRSVTEVIVTEEPAGGSRVPTGPPVVVAHID